MLWRRRQTFRLLLVHVSGVGCAMVTVSLIVCIYYNVIMSYTVHYMVSSFASEVPWSKCDPMWADMSTCYVRGSRAVSTKMAVFWFVAPCRLA
jgi:SNF family Na+-dependent transporter